MIYFFDVNHELVKVVTSENIVSARHEQELNGIIISDIELNLSYTKSFIEQASLFGYYYKGTFYLHNIQRVEDFHGDDLVSIHGRHIFFNDMQYGKLIEDVRPTDRNAYDMLAQTIETNTRWSLDFHATTGRLSTNFYWKTPYEVLEWVVNNFRLEYEPRILFDGQQINGYMLHINNALGDNTGIRIPYGDRVLSLTHDVDYSEVITRLAPRGRGELLEGGSYGRRINIKDVEVNQDGIVSPIGDYYLENTSISHQYESDRHAEIIFEDIEDVETLIEEGISAYQDMSRPKMNFEADVQDIGDVNIGDSVAIIRHEYEIFFNARVHMITVDLMNESDAQVELGDYEHFRESKSERAQRRVRENLIKESERFDREVQQMREEFEQALIDAHAEIDAIDERMSTEIANEIASFETEFNLEVQAAKDLAEQKALEHSDAVRGELNTFADVHSQIVQDLEDNVMDIDDFLGDISGFTLDDRLQDINLEFQDRINNLNLNTRNILRGTDFEDATLLNLYGSAEIRTGTGSYPKIVRMTSAGGGNTSSFMFLSAVTFEADEDYFLTLEHRSYAVPELDYLQIRRDDGTFRTVFDADKGVEGFTGLPATGTDWHRATIRIRFNQTVTGNLSIGTRYDRGDTSTGWIDVFRPYLTNTSNREWVPHPQDNNQSIQDIATRVTDLEDGRQTLITRSEYDFDTGQINQTLTDITETVDTNSTMIANIEEYDVIKNGSLVMQTVNGFEQKVWDTTEEINPNLIPQSSNAWEDGRYWSTLTEGLVGDHERHIKMKRDQSITVFSGVTHTFNDESPENSGISHWLINFTDWTRDTPYGDQLSVPRGGSMTFTTPVGATRILLTAMAMDGFTVNTSRIEEPGKRIFAKLEQGSTATPMLNAISHIEQLSNEVSIAVQEIDSSGLVRQSDINVSPSSVRIGSTEILGDDVLSSVLNVSPSAIDMITQKMRLSGDLYVDGDITALAVTAIEGNFSNIVSANLTAGVISASLITTGTLSSARLQVNNALINRLIANSILTGEMRSQSLTAVRGDIADLRTRILTSNVVVSEHISSSNAMIDKLFATNALISRLTSKTAFISQIRSNIIDANTIRVGFNDISNNVTITPNGIDISEGALTIRRPDGAVWIQNGMPRNQFNAQVNQFITTGTDATWTGSAYRTSARSLVQVANIYTVHEGRYLDVHIATNMTSASSSSSAYIRVRVEGFDYTGASNDVKTEGYFATRGAPNDTHSTITIDLGVPTYNLRQFYVSFGFSSDTSDNNFATMRIKRASVRG